MSGRCWWRHSGVPVLDVSAVSRLLLQHWDVLAVAESDVQPANEYMHEAEAVLALLTSGSDAAAIADYLGSAAEDLHAVPNASRDRRAALAVWELAAFEEERPPVRDPRRRAGAPFRRDSGPFDLLH